MITLLSPESLSRACASKPRRVVGLWVVLSLVAAFIAFGPPRTSVGLDLLDSATTTELRLTGGVESERAKRLLEEVKSLEASELRIPVSVAEIVVTQSDSLTVDDLEFRAKAESVFGSLIALGDDVVAGGLNYYLTEDESLVSADRQTTLMPINVTGELGQAIENIEQLVHVTSEADRTDGFRVLIAGEASIAFENNELAEADLQKGERFGIPVALIILLIIFGAALAAFLPILLAIVSIGVSLGIASLVGQVFEMSFLVTLMITMIGLAVGIDYSLLVVSRYREELRRGETVRRAVATAGATAGRTVLFSGLTVVFALCGMFIIPSFFSVHGPWRNNSSTGHPDSNIHRPARSSCDTGAKNQLPETAPDRACSHGALRRLRRWILGHHDEGGNQVSRRQPPPRWWNDDRCRSILFPDKHRHQRS